MATKKASKAKAATAVGEYLVCREAVACVKGLKARYQPVMVDNAAMQVLVDAQGGRCYACGKLRELDQLRAVGVE